MLVLVLGFAAAVVAVMALRDGPEMAIALEMATEGSPGAIDSADWAKHWQVSSTVMLILGATLGVAGAGMSMRRRWSLAVLAAAAAALLALELLVVATGYAKYAYEEFDWAEAAFLSVVVLGSVLGYVRWRRSPAVR